MVTSEPMTVGKRSTGQRREDPRERAFVMSGEEVRATRAGLKTQARRVIPIDWFRCLDPDDPDDMPNILAQSPLGVPGDRLYVRETWAPSAGGFAYRADAGLTYPSDDGRWRSPATMPRNAARLILTLTAIRAERVQDITVDDIIAEGIPVPPVDYSVPERPDVLDYERRTFARDAFMSRWDRDHKHHPEHQWSANPWVWVPEFTVERVA